MPYQERVWHGLKLKSNQHWSHELNSTPEVRTLKRELLNGQQEYDFEAELLRDNLRSRGRSLYLPRLLSTSVHNIAEVMQRMGPLDGKKILIIGGSDAEAEAWHLKGAKVTVIQPDEHEAVGLEHFGHNLIRGNVEDVLPNIREKFDAVVSKAVLQPDVIGEENLRTIIDHSLNKANLHVHVSSGYPADGSKFCRPGWKTIEKTFGTTQVIVLEKLKPGKN